MMSRNWPGSFNLDCGSMAHVIDRAVALAHFGPTEQPYEVIGVRPDGVLLTRKGVRYAVQAIVEPFTPYWERDCIRCSRDLGAQNPGTLCSYCQDDES